MDEIAEDAGGPAPPEDAAEPGLVLRTATGEFRILQIGADGCTIAAAAGMVLPGYADIYRFERQMARCLIVAAAAGQGTLRCAFKRRTPARLEPPRDFA